MDIVVKMGKRNVVLGTIEISENNEFQMNGMPFSTKEIKLGRSLYKVKLMAFSNCNDFLLFFYELYSKESLYLLVKITKEGAKRDRFEYIQEDDPKKVFEVLLRDMRKYNSRNEEYDYAGMFQTFFSKEGVES